MPKKSPTAVPPGTRTASSVPGQHRWKCMVSCGVLPMGLSLCFPRARRPRVSDHLRESAGVLSETQKSICIQEKRTGYQKNNKREQHVLGNKKRKNSRKKKTSKEGLDFKIISRKYSKSKINRGRRREKMRKFMD